MFKSPPSQIDLQNRRWKLIDILGSSSPFEVRLDLPDCRGNRPAKWVGEWLAELCRRNSRTANDTVAAAQKACDQIGESSE